MVVTVSSLGILLFVLIVVFILNKRRLITYSYPLEFPVKTSKEGVLSLLTYNVAGLPEHISSAKTPRAESTLLIGQKINTFDIVNVQEDFNYNRQLYEGNLHPYKTRHRGKAVWGDGLNTLSNYPISELKRVAWRNCNGSDCLTPKGFSLAKVCLAQDVYVDVYNVHATSGNSIAGAKARRRNLQQFADYIIKNSSDQPLIVMGDFNAHYQFNLDNMHDFLHQTQLQDSWVETILQGKYPVVQDDFEIISDLEYTNNLESIDKILFRNSNYLTFTPVSFQIELDHFLDDEQNHLSDHLAVSTSLHWKAK